MSADLNDSLADLINAPMGEVRTAIHAPTDYQPAGHWEACPKCRGTGMTRWGVCFKCQGKKGKSYKTSASERRARVEKDHARQAARSADAWHSFVEAKPELAVWIETERSRFDFAEKMHEAVLKFGSLTEGQEAAIGRMIEKAKARAAERAERQASAPEADAEGVDRLKAAFDNARDYATKRGRGIRNLRLTIGGIVISPAGGASKNAGALYVKNGGEYLGKIQGGRFFAVRECTQDQERRVLAFVKDPKAAAKAYGQETGVCCVCNATLTNEESIAGGIGPICATKFGW